MARPKQDYKEDILKLLNRTWKSTSQITDEGKSKGLYNRWESYKTYLDELLNENKVEVMEVPKKEKVQRFWRLA